MSSENRETGLDLGLVGPWASRSQLISMASFQGPNGQSLSSQEPLLLGQTKTICLPSKDQYFTHFYHFADSSAFSSDPFPPFVLLKKASHRPRIQLSSCCWCCFPFPLMPIAIATNASKVGAPQVMFVDSLLIYSDFMWFHHHKPNIIAPDPIFWYL